MTLIFALLFLIYLLFVVALVVGWNKSLTQEVPSIAKQESLLSIIIPVRNEGKVIVNLLEDIRNQSYKNFEVVVVDDHSRDNTYESVVPYTINDNRFKLLNSKGEGKKAALTQGVQDSHGEIIVTTDGDCRVGGSWLTSLSSYFQDDNSKMVFGGVKIEGNSFFSEIQAHEFLSLIGTASATLAFGFPTMCNGANLAYRRSVFAEVEGLYGQSSHSIGR